MASDDTIRQPPLAGLKVLELEGIAMAPFTGMVLADLGCDVVRVDPPLKPQKKTQKRWLDSLCRHKKSIIVDFEVTASRQAFLRLLEAADILIDSYRPGIFDRMIGMNADELCRRYPRLIYARVTGYSRYDARYAHAMGHENNFVAVSGAIPALQHVPPTNSNSNHNSTLSKPTVNYLADFGGGSMSCVVGILAAVIHRSASGKGQIVDASVQQSTSYLATFPLQRRHGQPDNEPSLTGVNNAPWSDIYETSDGKYMMVSSIEDALYERLIRGLGIEPASVPSRTDRGNWPAIRGLLTDRFASQSQDYWRSVFDKMPACVSPVLDVDDVDVHQPLVYLSRTPSLPTIAESMVSENKIPELVSGRGNEEVVRRWLRADDICTDDGSCIRVVSKSKL
ncbi:alpha methylacyl-CoA racemase, putative [Talaromyces stipitatus ATCC 10500]|uniref:Alpha methylacyl-CoA racemase, putative n=1 Tax=Talaromyces stipitatus (strain ATCC 10500 / CBS 375.48 / QM 6759 / NRRL 1006) TaxID=441959 RepID=B8MNK1_TALSN|nr:alpha methylacyl-CoA racemase, putative [Talaromyces stipitatus ATCC 10500]EED14090.1 alpha methylacyl-CoA racemase, putative [Talaromyces stipitatus ATCC 10500]